MVRFAADENLNNHIVIGLLERDPTIDIVRVQDSDLAGAGDPAVLQWAAEDERILLTHDVTTMPTYASSRLEAGLPMPGLFLILQNRRISEVIENLLLIAEVSLDNEWDGQIRYLPL